MEWRLIPALGMQSLIGLITSADPEVRNKSLDAFAQASSVERLLAACFSSRPSIVSTSLRSW